VRSTIRAGRIDSVVAALLATPLVGVGLAAFVFSLEPELGSRVTSACRVIGFGSIVAAAAFSRHLARPRPRLRVSVSGDSILFQLRGRPNARFWRANIEMVVIEQGLVSQTSSLSVYGPDRVVLGTWDTGWIAKPTMKVIETLESHGYPHDFRHTVPRPPLPADTDWSVNDRRRVRLPL